MKKKAIRLGMALAIGIGALMSLTGTASASNPDQSPPIQLVNYNSGKCLEIADWRTDNGAPARQWDCTGGKNQKWYVNIDLYGRRTYVNAYSGKCLEVADWRTDNGAPIRQWDCTGGANQYWYWDSYGSAFPSYVYSLHNANSAKNVVTQGLYNGSPAFQYDDLIYADQGWYTM